MGIAGLNKPHSNANHLQYSFIFIVLLTFVTKQLPNLSLINKPVVKVVRNHFLRQGEQKPWEKLEAKGNSSSFKWHWGGIFCTWITRLAGWFGLIPRSDDLWKLLLNVLSYAISMEPLEVWLCRKYFWPSGIHFSILMTFFTAWWALCATCARPSYFPGCSGTYWPCYLHCHHKLKLHF